MAINSVTSAANAVQQIQQPKAQAQNIQASDDASREREVQTSSRPQRAEQERQAQNSEQPKPVVNAQGQKTGTIINTTA